MFLNKTFPESFFKIPFTKSTKITKNSNNFEIGLQTANTYNSVYNE